MKGIYFKLDEELKKRFQMKLIEDNQTMNDFFKEKVEEYLEQ